MSLTAQVQELAAEFAAEQPGRDLRVSIAEGLIADGDAVLTRMILRELLSNAWKFTSQHDRAHVEVGATEVGGESVFFVRDDDAGFDMRGAHHLFGVFQRMHLSTQFEGQGVGLAMVQRLVAKHGEHVWAEAEVEHGATLHFTLPKPAASA